MDFFIQNKVNGLFSPVCFNQVEKASGCLISSMTPSQIVMQPWVNGDDTLALALAVILISNSSIPFRKVLSFYATGSTTRSKFDPRCTWIIGTTRRREESLAGACLSPTLAGERKSQLVLPSTISDIPYQQTPFCSLQLDTTPWFQKSF